MTGFGFGAPVTTPSWGILDRPAIDSAGPTIAVLYYRAQQLAGNTAYVEALCSAIEDAGGGRCRSTARRCGPPSPTCWTC